MLKRTFVFILFVIFGLGVQSFAQTPEVIENYDLKRYNPKKYGLKDLAFEVRYENLTKQMKERLNTDDISDVYFKVLWIFPGKFDISVEGLPKGFKEIKRELRAMVKTRLDMVIPSKMQGSLRSYSMKVQKKGNGKRVIAKDPSNSKAINKVYLDFANSGKLRRVKTFSPMGTNVSKMEMSAKSWSNNKWVTDRTESKTISGVQITKIIQKIEYKGVGGFGFPGKMTTKTIQQLVKNGGKKSKEMRNEESQTITFSNYQVNEDKAKNLLIE